MSGQQASVTRDETPSMAGKTVLITGGSGGIGKATAVGLAALGARVAITGRDLGRAEAAAVEIRAATGNPEVDAYGADLSSQAEVRRLAAEVLDAYPRLDVLVNNVGGSWATRHVTVDGLEHTFAVNHLAAFLLTNLLLHRLKASAPARIVSVSSGAQSLGRIDFEDLQGERSYSEQKAYPQSKLATVMFTYELARRLEGTRRDGHRAAPRRGAHRVRRRGSLADLQAPRPVVEAIHEDTRSRARRHRSTWRPRRRWRASRACTSPTASRRSPTRRPTTSPPRTACGRSAPASWALRRRGNPRRGPSSRTPRAHRGRQVRRLVGSSPRSKAVATAAARSLTFSFA